MKPGEWEETSAKRIIDQATSTTPLLWDSGDDKKQFSITTSRVGSNPGLVSFVAQLQM